VTAELKRPHNSHYETVFEFASLTGCLLTARANTVIIYPD